MTKFNDNWDVRETSGGFLPHIEKDRKGRKIRAYGRIRHDMKRKGTPVSDKVRQEMTRLVGDYYDQYHHDHCGHIIPMSWGGSGEDIDNIIPQNASVNIGSAMQFDRNILNERLRCGYDIVFEYHFTYDDDEDKEKDEKDVNRVRRPSSIQRQIHFYMDGAYVDSELQALKNEPAYSEEGSGYEPTPSPSSEVLRSIASGGGEVLRSIASAAGNVATNVAAATTKSKALQIVAKTGPKGLKVVPKILLVSVIVDAYRIISTRGSQAATQKVAEIGGEWAGSWSMGLYGAEIGTLMGGPVGTAIGGTAGMIVGALAGGWLGKTLAR